MFNKKVIEEIYRNHSKPLEGSVHKEYNVGNILYFMFIKMVLEWL